ncbi:MAG: zinc ABC transporter substrate-binding protein [Victivallales bacterium]|nr:zinc ABC transporter substrate-binding protein [Victivallales bacterium]
MKKTILLIILAATCMQAAPIHILTTTTDLKSITQMLTGGLAEVTSLTTGKEDPHDLTSRPSFVVKARQADLWIRIGLELEIGWESAVLRDSRNRRIQVGAPGHLDVSQGVEPLDIPAAHVGREAGDVHPLGNPHYWLDPLNGRIIAHNIATRLMALFPEHKETFAANLHRFEQELDERMFGKNLVAKAGSGEKLWLLAAHGELDKFLKDNNLKADVDSWYGRLTPYHGAPIATYHRSWLYFIRRFNLQLAGELEPKPGIPPSAKHLLSLVDSFKEKGVHVILQEPFYSLKAAQLLSSRMGAQIVVCPNCVNGGDGCDDYFKMMDNLVVKLSGALSK